MKKFSFFVCFLTSCVAIAGCGDGGSVEAGGDTAGDGAATTVDADAPGSDALLADSGADPCPNGSCIVDFEPAHLCAPCVSHEECNQGAGHERDRCVALSPRTGYFCGLDCSDRDCPEGFACAQVVDVQSGRRVRHCAPVGGACPCTTHALERQATTVCGPDDCQGYRFCTPQGLGQCQIEPCGPVGGPDAIAADPGTATDTGATSDPGVAADTDPSEDVAIADEGTADEGTADEGTADEGTTDDGVADEGAVDEGVVTDEGATDEGGASDDGGATDTGVATDDGGPVVDPEPREICYPGEADDGGACFDLEPATTIPGTAYDYPDPDGAPGQTAQYQRPTYFLDLDAIDLTTRVSPNFRLSEFVNPEDGRYGLVSPAMVAHLQAMRESLGVPLFITAGYRSPARNLELSRTVPYSRHIYGDGVDLFTRGATTLQAIADACNAEGASFVEVFTSAVHCDWGDNPLPAPFFAPVD